MASITSTISTDDKLGTLWGLRTATHSTASASTTSGTALAANTARKAALIVNDSSVEQYLNITGSTAVVNQGIRLNANGGSYYVAAETGNLTVSAITVVSASGSGNIITVTEWV